MKNNIFGMPLYAYKSKHERKIWILLALLMTVLMFNIVLTLFRSDANHIILLIINIVVDIVVAWVATFYISAYLLPESRKIKLFNSAKTTFTGKIEEIGKETETVMRFECYRVRISGRIFFAINASPLKFKVGREVIIHTSDNIIASAMERD